MKPSEIPTVPGFTLAQNNALAHFEKAHAEYGQSVIGHTRKRMNAADLVNAWEAIKREGITSSLTDTERADVRFAQQYLKS